MGTVGFTQQSEGSTPQEAFENAVLLAKLMNGIGGYESEIQNKTGFIELKELPSWILVPNHNVLFKTLSLAEDILQDKAVKEYPDREAYLTEYFEHVGFLSDTNFANDLLKCLAQLADVIGIPRLLTILDWRSSTDGLCLAVEAYDGSWIFFGASSKQKSKYRRGGRQF